MRLILLAFILAICLQGCNGSSSTDAADIGSDGGGQPGPGGGDDGDDGSAVSAVVWPIGKSITSDCVQDPFGHRLLGGKHDFHPGVDTCDDDSDDINDTETGEIVGLPVHAVASGRVVRVRPWNPDTCDSLCRQGNFVVIDHTGQPGFGEDSVQTVYMHMAQDSLLVEEGDEIERGEQIGLVGNTGKDINTVHLHLGFLRGIGSPGKIDSDKYVNPFAYLPIEPPAGSNRIEKSVEPVTNVFDAGECDDATNALLVTISQQKPFYDFIGLEVVEEATGERLVLNIDTREGMGSDGTQDDFEHDCIAVKPVDHDEKSTENVLGVYFGGSWTTAEHVVTLVRADGSRDEF